jgi:GntR family transcriptional regulator, histidine utilization repressor
VRRRGLDAAADRRLGGDAVPLYQRAKEHIVANIVSGKWRPNQRILSEHELARHFAVSRITANRAMAELANEGYIVRVTGVGSFVADRMPQGHLVEIHSIADEIALRGHVHSSKVLAHEAVRASGAQALEFGLEVGAQVFHSLVIHMENDVPIQLENRYVSPAAAPNYLSIDLTRQTANAFLCEVAPLARAEHVVRAVMPSQKFAKLLKMDPEEACLLLHRRTWTNDKVASIVDLHHPGSRYELVAKFDPRSR